MACLRVAMPPPPTHSSSRHILFISLVGSIFFFLFFFIPKSHFFLCPFFPFSVLCDVCVCRICWNSARIECRRRRSRRESCDALQPAWCRPPGVSDGTSTLVCRWSWIDSATTTTAPSIDLDERRWRRRSFVYGSATATTVFVISFFFFCSFLVVIVTGGRSIFLHFFSRPAAAVAVVGRTRSVAHAVAHFSGRHHPTGRRRCCLQLAS